MILVGPWQEELDAERWERRAAVDGREVVVATLECVLVGWRWSIALNDDGTVRPPRAVKLTYARDAVDACARVLAKLRAAGAAVEGPAIPAELVPVTRQRECGGLVELTC